MELQHDKIKAATSQFTALGNPRTRFIVTLFQTTASHHNHFTVLWTVYFDGILFTFGICELQTARVH